MAMIRHYSWKLVGGMVPLAHSGWTPLGALFLHVAVDGTFLAYAKEEPVRCVPVRGTSGCWCKHAVISLVLASR